MKNSTILDKRNHFCEPVLSMITYLQENYIIIYIKKRVSFISHQKKGNKMKLLVFDVGGTQIKYAVAEDALNLSEKGSVPTPSDSFESFEKQISDIYLQCKDTVQGVAMSLPGPVDVKNGYIFNCGAMKYRHDKEVAKLLEETCGCTVVLENDGKAAALAEHRYGAIRDCSNAAVFLIGTGVGGGLIINNELVRGIHSTAGEFSFINTEADHYDDYGNILGNRCSTTFLLKRYRELSGIKEEIDGKEFFRRLENDEAAQNALDELCRNIAVQILNLSCLLDLEKVAIGGGISKQPILIDKIREKFEEVKQRSFTGRIGFKTHTQIVPCQFHNDANLIGAFITYAERENQ
jgi:predicted NBD/HSP70 family sugar kinase